MVSIVNSAWSKLIFASINKFLFFSTLISRPTKPEINLFLNVLSKILVSIFPLMLLLNFSDANS